MADLTDFLEKFNLDVSEEMLSRALTHPSYHSTDPSAISYEQLETLGDAVLDVLVTAELLSENSNFNPGDLTTRRSILVNNRTLSQLGGELGITNFIRKSPSYNLRNSDIADVVEALFGAIYIEGDMKSCEDFYAQIKSVLKKITEEIGKSVIYNPVSMLQEFCQARDAPLPLYKVVYRAGPDHNPSFTIKASVKIDNKTLVAQGKGSSKKKARFAAARELLDQLNISRHIS